MGKRETEMTKSSKFNIKDRVGHEYWPKWKGTITRIFENSQLISVDWDWNQHPWPRVEFSDNIIPLNEDN